MGTDLGIPKETNRLASALVISLENWAKSSPKYKDLFRTLSKEILVIARDAFLEMQPAKPGVYDFWWAQNHNRYIRDFKQRELLTLHEIMYHFLTAYSRGEFLEYVNAKGKKGRQGKA